MPPNKHQNSIYSGNRKIHRGSLGYIFYGNHRVVIVACTYRIVMKATRAWG